MQQNQTVILSMFFILAHAASLKWIVPTFLMLGSAPIYTGIWSIWRILTILFPRDIYRKGDDFLWSLYQRGVLFCFHTYTGLQCLVDWVITDMLAIQQSSEGQVRYIVKDGIKFFPLYGFSFRQHHCCYVKRGSSFNHDKFSWIVIFPEGTRYNPELLDVIERSQQFAKNAGHKPFKYLLTPRTKALNVCRKQLANHVTAVYDLTIGYSDTQDPVTGERTLAPSIPEFISGSCKQLHIYLERIELKDVPEEEEELKKWLYKQYEKKERLMSGFYSKHTEVRGKFPGKGELLSIHRRQTLPAFLFFSSALLVILGFPRSRSAYWKFGLLSTI
ncbi:hypothetical protein KUTeg_016803 [Tegillarca granosa]|uniref:Phospholipid/glycerol acyltransferase domain-containing protein n=1 Tax=Tegillarca granosa TaxID=220873 RepID=A0ABQ9ELZ0_TEGGR|nr:hypothetical protein KUTeg_016803 [Tegillarca granosa]